MKAKWPFVCFVNGEQQVLVLREKMKLMVMMTIMTMTMDSLFLMATYQMMREWRMERRMIVEKVKRIRCGYNHLYNNQINACALIGQSAMVYCASKPTEKSRVLRIIIYM